MATRCRNLRPLLNARKTAQPRRSPDARKTRQYFRGRLCAALGQFGHRGCFFITTCSSFDIGLQSAQGMPAPAQLSWKYGLSW
jgi:hypothetical protein